MARPLRIEFEGVCCHVMVRTSESHLSYSYDYDANGNVAAITDGATGTNQRGNQDMVYDGLNRLTEVTSPMFGTATYAYDELDNLTRVKLTDGTAARDYYLCYASSTNRLDTVRTGGCGGSTVTSFGYDAQGNVTSKGGTTFDFDHGNRLREVVGAGGTSSYLYDGRGRRMNDFVSGPNGGHKYSHYLMDGRLNSTRDERRGTDAPADGEPSGVDFSGVESYYFYLGSRLIAIREHDWSTEISTVKYQHTDALGSPVMVTDETRQVLTRYEYEPYGQVLDAAPPDGHPGYTGHVFDAATGLNYMQQRYYDPAIGRFLSVDPVEANRETGANFNRYWYADNNPYTFVDPDGRRCEAPTGTRICQGPGGNTMGTYDEGPGQRAREEFAQQVARQAARESAAGLATVAGVGTIIFPLADCIGETCSGGELVLAGIASWPAFRWARGTKPLLGKNPGITKSRANTDLPGDKATAKSIFRNQTKGQKIDQQPLGNGGVRRTAEDGTHRFTKQRPQSSGSGDYPH